jgi:threonine/homoserine/homoserine lactone efflux protein
LDSSLVWLAARGLALGLSIAAPVGPIGLLCIRRTLAQGRAAGLLSGLGAATADAVYGSGAAFGLTAVSDMLVTHRAALGLAGGLFLVYLGVKTALARPSSLGASPAALSGAGAYASTFVLTLANPMTIISFAAAFTALGLGQTGGAAGGAALVAGVFGGSALWWLTLSAVVARVGRGLGPGALAWVNRASGLVIMAFGLAAVAGSLATAPG